MQVCLNSTVYLTETPTICFMVTTRKRTHICSSRMLGEKRFHDIHLPRLIHYQDYQYDQIILDAEWG